jgi:hypothetical protein
MEEPMTDEAKFPEAELARLADGSLAASRQQEWRAKLGSSPELAAALAEQQRAVSLLRAVDEPAPAALQARIEALSGATSRRRPAPRWRRTLALPAATALAVAVAAVVILAGGGGTAGPTVPQTVGLTLAAATMPAPAADTAHYGQLTLHAAGIPFPDWTTTAGWRTVGARSDGLDGRRIVTVFYTGTSGGRVGYAIVAGTPLPAPQGRSVKRYGVRFTLLQQGSARLVTWRRAGHTCVIAGRSTGYQTLLALATAEGRRAP